MTSREAALREILPPHLADSLPYVGTEEKDSDVIYDELLEKLANIRRIMGPREVIRVSDINHRRLAYSSSEEVTPLPLSARFWAIVTVLVGAVSAVLGVCVWQLVLALSTGSWTTAWPVPVWGILLSLCLFLTIAAGVWHRLTSGH